MVPNSARARNSTGGRRAKSWRHIDECVIVALAHPCDVGGFAATCFHQVRVLSPWSRPGGSTTCPQARVHHRAPRAPLASESAAGFGTIAPFGPPKSGSASSAAWRTSQGRGGSFVFQPGSRAGSSSDSHRWHALRPLFTVHRRRHYTVHGNKGSAVPSHRDAAADAGLRRATTAERGVLVFVLELFILVPFRRTTSLVWGQLQR